MKSFINSSLIFSLLTLAALWGCESAESETTSTGVAPDFSSVSAEDLRATIRKSERQFVLVNFYATWCKPCKVEMPELVELQKDPASEVQVLFVSLDEPDVIEGKLASFLQEYQVDFPSYTGGDDPEGLVRAFVPDWDGYIPLSLLFDKQGAQIEQLGMTDRQEVEMILNRHKMLN